MSTKIFSPRVVPDGRAHAMTNEYPASLKAQYASLVLLRGVHQPTRHQHGSPARVSHLVACSAACVSPANTSTPTKSTGIRTHSPIFLAVPVPLFPLTCWTSV